jgi:hypothetical protein
MNIIRLSMFVLSASLAAAAADVPPLSVAV